MTVSLQDARWLRMRVSSETVQVVRGRRPRYAPMPFKRRVGTDVERDATLMTIDGFIRALEIGDHGPYRNAMEKAVWSIALAYEADEDLPAGFQVAA